MSTAAPANAATQREPADPSRIDWLADFPPPRSLPLDQEALRVYELAYALGDQMATGEAKGAPRISFTSLLAALLAGRSRTANWFYRRAKSIGPTSSLVFLKTGMSEDDITKLKSSDGRPETLNLSKPDNQLLTSSSRAVLQNAEEWAHRVGSTDIGVRHLVAAYVLNPPLYHRNDLAEWNFKESSWPKEFFAWAAKFYTSEPWSDSISRPAPTRAIPTFELPQVKGERLAFPGDPGVLAVLEMAATLHARRVTATPAERGLDLKTVFFALIETAREKPNVRTAIGPIWEAAANNTAYDNEFAKLAPSDAKSADQSFNNVDISPGVLNALEAARALATATRRDDEAAILVTSLHLAGALVSRRVDADDELAPLGLTLQKLRLDIINAAQRPGQSDEAWREALGEEESLKVGRPVELNSDEPDAVVRQDQEFENDPLSIRRDVESFGALLASRNLEPPLSIGLFGPWGSGKTTFLRRLRRAVEQRAEEARKRESDEASAFVGNVVHVEFNAWHFSEGALTSSLVDTILRALSAYIEGKAKATGLAWEQLKLEGLDSTQRKVEAADALARAADRAVTTARDQLKTAHQKAGEEAAGLTGAAERVWDATKTELLKLEVVRKSGIVEAVGDAIASREQLRTRLDTVRARPARMLGDLGWPGSLFFAALVLAVPPAVAWLVGRIPSAGQVSQALTTMTAILSVVTLWLRAASGAVAKVDAVVAQVADEYANQMKRDPKVIAAQAAVDTAQAAAVTAAENLKAAQDALARAQADAANATLPMQMLQLATRRIEDGTYNKELTTLSLARADLEALTKFLLDQRIQANAKGNGSTPPANPAAKPVRPVDRIILYIDDLDRCRPEDVVRVLQMVHMLLAFELFVVVVAVDARWVGHALRTSYRWLSSDQPAAASPNGNDVVPEIYAEHVTPQDYLEKIFQISFWLEPMTAPRAAQYLASLVRPMARKNGEDGAVIASKVVIEGLELDYMRALSAYVGPSPRRVKRFVNAYRLIKARMSDTQLTTFLDDRTSDDAPRRSGPYQIVIALLVIGTGAPAASARILKELAECDPGGTFNGLVARFRERNDTDWSMAAQVIETLMRTQNAADVSELRGWARSVGRFLLNAPNGETRPAV